MTKIPAIRSSDRQLFDQIKSLLLRADWQFESVGEQPIVSVEIPWEAPVSVEQLLKHGEDDWRLIWKTKTSPDTYVGVGVCCILDWDQLKSIEIPKSVRAYGGIRFPSASQHDEKWDQIENQFVIPELEWKIRDSQVSLTVRQVRKDSSAEDMMDSLSTKLSALLGHPIYPREFEKLTVNDLTPYPDKLEWIKRVETALTEIQSGKLSKIVLSRFVDIKSDKDIDPISVVTKICALSEQSYVFGLFLPNGLSFVSRSPERLLAWSDSWVALDAIAGTRKRWQVPGADFAGSAELKSSVKDQNEHEFVTKFVEAYLSEFCSHYKMTKNAEILKLKNVQHMRSSYEGQLDPKASPLHLLEKLNPTPAVGGLPRNEALSRIPEIESFNRGLFSGAVGCLSGNSGDFAIGIRSALISGKTLRCFAGAGIVQGSDPDLEWTETEIKMKNFLDLFPEPEISL